MRLREALVPLGLSLSFAALACSYLVVVPLWEAPDEPTHLSTALTLAKTKIIPTPQHQPLFPGVTQNAKMHPPLYYAFLGGLLAATAAPMPSIQANPFGGVSRDAARYQHQGGIPADRFPGASHLRVSRMTSVALGSATVWVVWAASMAATGGWRLASFMGVSVFLLAPGFLFAHASIDPLPAAILLASLAIWRMVRMCTGGGFGPRQIRALGVILALAAVTRASLVFLFPVALGLVVRRYRERKGAVGDLIGPVVLFWIWAAILAPGPMLHAYRHLGSKLLRVRASLLTPLALKTLLIETKNTFWARFGWADLAAPPFVIDLFDTLTVVCVVGLVVAWRRRWVPKVAWLWAVVLGLGVLGYTKANLAWFDPQGRYLFVLAAVYAPLGGVCLASLVRNLRPWLRRAIALALFALMGATNVYLVFKVIAPAYGRTHYQGLGVDALQEVGINVEGATSVGQSFIARRPGLARVELYVSPSRNKEYRYLEFRLMESAVIGEPIAVARVPYPGPGDSPYVGFSFEPQWNSEGRAYYVRVTAVPTAMPVPVYFTVEDRYLGGTRYSDDTPQPGDLRFTTYFVTAEPSGGGQPGSP